MALLASDQRIIARAANNVPTVWVGRPKTGFYLRGRDAAMVGFGAIFLLFGMFLFGSALLGPGGSDAPVFLPFFATFWLAIAFSQTILPVLLAHMARSRTYYGLTSDAYALIATDFFGFHVKRVYLPAVDNIQLDLGGNGAGTITFGSAGSTPPWFGRSWGYGPRPPAFERIDNAAGVYNLCSKLQSGKLSGTTSS
jgi:hypothetical protein